ncbi:MAG: hypothetical protein ACO3VI_11960, partial [Ilumatobacteraceae bacterium]
MSVGVGLAGCVASTGASAASVGRGSPLATVGAIAPGCVAVSAASGVVIVEESLVACGADSVKELR